MSNHERIRRPPPARTDPIRNWSTLFRAPAADGEAQPVASLDDAVSRSVELGYRVIEEYVRHGQQVAQRFSSRTLGPDAAVADATELAARMAQYASDLVSTWFQFVEASTMGARDGAMQSAGSAAAPPVAVPSARAAASAQEAARVMVSVGAGQAAEVTVELRPDADPARLVAHALRAAHADAPQLKDVTIAQGPDGIVRVHVVVPPGHPGGTYSGLVVDGETSRPMGSISVHVG